MVDKNDWRLQGQEDYLMNENLYYIKFEPYSEAWEHEHCQFCWGTFALVEDGMKTGYCTKKKNERRARWICETCYNDFKDMFNWNVSDVKTDVITHYDLLIDENNDPVRDAKPLKEYMDKWDGVTFIEKMNVDKSHSVLEIGVGTGRIAIRVAPLCKKFTGVDISPKTVERAKENLADFENVELICDDFLSVDFDEKFDVVYSSLTFMHINDKQKAFDKVEKILNNGGRLILSIDKNQDKYIDMKNRKIEIYPDNVDDTEEYIKNANLQLENRFETEFAHIFVCSKGE